MYDELYEESKKHARQTAWVFSDLQQNLFENAKRCFDICMEDYDRLGRPAETMWYLGDSVEGSDLDQLAKMTEMQVKGFESLGIPLCYVTGNHDYDVISQSRKEGKIEMKIPFYEAVRAHEGWHTTGNCEDLYFRVPFGNYEVFFLSDHVARDGSWLVTHNYFRWGKENYPYGLSDYQAVSREMENCGKRVITAAHCAFPGGNRDTYLMSRMQPLPLNVRLHLYGHSHIGEYFWPKERVFSQINWIDWQDIPQVDVASFENIRGSYCHSVILHVYEDDSLGLFFRNHDAHRFESAYFPPRDTFEKPGEFVKSEEVLRVNFPLAADRDPDKPF